MKKRKIVLFLILVVILILGGYFTITRINFSGTKPGAVVDSLDSVYVYHNGGVNQSYGRNTVDGYNVGVKYQCVEFVKRYYFQHYNHQMPDSYGHAKDFFDCKVAHHELNVKRNLVQYYNGKDVAPEKGDIIVFEPYLFNPYGHVAIICAVGDNWVEIIQQNYGIGGKSRERFELSLSGNQYTIEHSRVLGWLRKV